MNMRCRREAAGTANGEGPRKLSAAPITVSERAPFDEKSAVDEHSDAPYPHPKLLPDEEKPQAFGVLPYPERTPKAWGGWRFSVKNNQREMTLVPGAGGFTGGGRGIKRAGMDDPTPHRLSGRIARLEGEIKTSRAENEAMESRIDARLAGMEADMARRETRMLLAVAGMIGLSVAILGILISLSN